MALNTVLLASSGLSCSLYRHNSPRFCIAPVMQLKPMDAVKNMKKPDITPYDLKKMTVIHSMPPEKTEIFKYMEDWAEENLLPMLKPVEKSWQPHDFLPDPCSEDFFDRVVELKSRAAEIPDHYYVCLVGDMITEEALPTYLSFLNSLDGTRDETGASPSPWAQWSRSWTAEENRHGDLLNKYLYLCGRVNMKQVEKTIHYLIASGMAKFVIESGGDKALENPAFSMLLYGVRHKIKGGMTFFVLDFCDGKDLDFLPKMIGKRCRIREKNMGAENNPYLGFIYTSFQERATAIAHGNTARQAMEFGDVNLAKICGTIASDEKRHEAAYAKIIQKLFDLDPDATMMAFANMMRKKITMPGCLMYDGEDGNLFDHYSTVAQQTEVYTANDYVEIIEFFVERWNVDKVAAGLSGEGRKAQDYICNLAPKLRKLVERSKAKGKASPLVAFSWIFNRKV